MENEENYYLHLSWKKPKNISKLKGIKIESIAWDKLNTDPSTTREILIGSNKGKIYELCIEANERAFVERIGLGGKDQSFKLVCLFFYYIKNYLFKISRYIILENQYLSQV